MMSQLMEFNKGEASLFGPMATMSDSRIIIRASYRNEVQLELLSLNRLELLMEDSYKELKALDFTRMNKTFDTDCEDFYWNF